MNATYTTIAGNKAHYSANGTKTHCGRATAHAATAEQICKSCAKAQAKIDGVEYVAPVEVETVKVARVAKVAKPRRVRYTAFFLAVGTKNVARINASSKAEAESKLRKIPAAAKLVRDLAVKGQSWNLVADLSTAC